MKVLLSLMVLVCITSVCSAKTEYRHASGDCDGHTVGWWSTSRYDNGRLIETWGMDCNGREYHTFGRAVTVSGPSTGSPTENGICESDPAGGMWYAVTARNAYGIASDVWGRDCNGEFWHFVAESSTARQGTDDLPRGGERIRYEQVPMRTVPMGAGGTGGVPAGTKEPGIK